MSAKKRKAGRPSKYTPELQERICKAIADGQTQKIACEMAGIDVQTFANWREGNVDFSNAIARAHATFEQKAVEMWTNAAFQGFTIQGPKGSQDIAPDWRAAQALLKVRNREVYSESAQVELSGSGLSIHLHLGGEVI